MSFIDDESADFDTPQSTTECYLFGCELSSKEPFYTFQRDEDEEREHILELRTISLGIGAKEETNVVEVSAMNSQGKTVSVPIASLHINCLPSMNVGDFDLKAPVTIRLKAGSGPVFVSGMHVISSPAEDLDFSEEEEIEVEEDEMPAVKPAKKKQKQLEVLE